ncbi:MAG: DUF3008 domain-containing protein [Chloroflexi bacterium]|nr:MAG: DUF3008 domain-containing protein [Chloroflexota bacterium]
MPSVSKAQQHFMGMEYAKKKAGKKTDVKMTKQQLKDFASTKTKGLPARASTKKRRS